MKLSTPLLNKTKGIAEQSLFDHLDSIHRQKYSADGVHSNVHRPEETAIYSLASGSKGNATLFAFGDECLLIDAGISCRRIKQAITSLGYSLDQLRGVCITHEHSDHVKGLPQLVKELGVPFYMKEKVFKYLHHHLGNYTNEYYPLEETPVQIGSITVEYFSTYHDAVDPIGFACYKGQRKLALLTDTGHITKGMLSYLEDSDEILLEANYDTDMLRYGPYPQQLKQRIAGSRGHMSNEDAARALCYLYKGKPLRVILGHRSAHNNHVECIDKMMNYWFTKEGICSGKDIYYTYGQPSEIVHL